MVKESIRFPLLYLAVSISWQLIVYREIQWIDNIGIFLMILLFTLLVNWSNKPYKWKKDREKLNE